MRGLAVAGACAIAALAGLPATAQVKPEADGLTTRPIDITARPITSFSKLGTSGARVGKLTFVGGLVLTSSDPHFGGWSGLAMDADGSGLFAISDGGAYLSARLVTENGKPKALAEAVIGPIRAMSGAGLAKGRDRDAEAITITKGSTRNGEALIAFEQNHRIGRFSISGGRLSAPKSYLRPKGGDWRISTNNGIEAMTVLSGGRHRGALIAIAETMRDKAGRHTGWLWVGDSPRRFTLSDIGGYDITDVAPLDDGGIVILERRFRWLEGVKMRLRRVSQSEIGVGRHIEGEVLLEADMASEIDNMEGLAAHPAPAGGTLLTLVSDDNFNAVLQRTLLLQFLLPPAD
ncbi:MAG: esterase-like activity of phytase family protein [Hyphomicrobiaceae bacterium]|nr:esterase-like activity of phytase family protein [Hyphomicrobiaceae bacterium]